MEVLAGVDNETFLAWHWDWEDSQLELSINRKEILACLAVVDALLVDKETNDPENLLDILAPIAVDNTTAVSAVTNWFFPADPELSAVLEEKHEACRRARLHILPIQVASEEEAADDGTRGRESSSHRRHLTLAKLRWAITDCGFELI